MEATPLNRTAVMQSGENKRIEKWDLLRALLIFLVVLGHLTDQYTSDSENMKALYLFIYTFHMPCFLLLDGLLGKRNVRERRYGRIFSYAFMYLFAKILISITKAFINHSVSFSLLEESGVPWYGLALFWCSLLTILLYRFPKKWVLIAAVIVACMVGYDQNVGDYLVLSRTLVFFPFYFAGYCLNPEKVAKKLSSPVIRICGALFLISLALVCLLQTDQLYFFRALLTGRNPYKVLGSTYGKDNLVSFGGLLRLLYYVIAVAGCISVISLVPNHLPHCGAIRAVGKHSLEIYLLHRPVIYILYGGFSFTTRLAAWGFNNWIVIPLALAVTALFALPFWEKPIRAIIYPPILEKNAETIPKEGQKRT